MTRPVVIVLAVIGMVLGGGGRNGGDGAQASLLLVQTAVSGELRPADEEGVYRR